MKITIRNERSTNLKHHEVCGNVYYAYILSDTLVVSIKKGMKWKLGGWEIAIYKFQFSELVHGPLVAAAGLAAWARKMKQSQFPLFTPRLIVA
jgi:hypothetical protein